MARSAKKEAPAREPEQKEKEGPRLSVGDETSVVRGDGTVESGWKVKSIDEDNGRYYLESPDGKTYKEPRFETVEGWQEEIEAAETPIEMGSLEDELPEGIEHVGSRFEVGLIDGPKLPLVYAGNAGEKLHVVALDQGEANIEGSGRARVAIKVEGSFGMQESAQREAESLQEGYGKMLDALLSSQGVEGDHAESVRAVAEARKGIYLAMSARTENPSEMLNGMLTNLLERSDEELLKMASPVSLLEADTQRRESEQDLIAADSEAAIKKAESGVLLSTYEAGLRRHAMAEAEGQKVNEAEIAAQAAGFVELMSSPLYQGSDAAENTRGRIKEIETKMNELESISDSQRTAGAEVALNQLWDERKSHMAVLPTLEKFESLENRALEVELQEEEATTKALDEVKAGLKSLWGKIGNRVARMNVLNKTIDRLAGFMDHFKDMLTDDQMEDATKEQLESAKNFTDLYDETEKIRAEETYLQEAGVLIEFDAEAELEPSKTQVYEHLMTLAKDGDADAVADYIEGRMDEDSISDVEKSVLSKALEDIDNRVWVADTEAPLGLEINDAINIEIGDTKLKAEVMGFTPDGRVLVKMEDGGQQTFRAEFVVKLDEAQSKESAELHADKEAFEAENLRVKDKIIADYNVDTSKELDLEVSEVNTFQEYYEALVPVLEAQGFTKEAFGLPTTWDDFLSAKKNVDNKGVLGWFKTKFGGKSEQVKLFDKLVESITIVRVDSKGVPPEVWERYNKAKTGFRVIMPGNVA